MNSTISLSLSTKAITQEIYAASALRCLQNLKGDTRPPLLTHDREPALHLLVKDSFAHMVLRLLPHIADCDMSAQPALDGEIIMRADFIVPAGFPAKTAIAVRHAVEHAIAMDALHLCYMGHDDSLSRRHAALANETLEEIKRLLSAADCTGASIAMNWL